MAYPRRRRTTYRKRAPARKSFTRKFRTRRVSRKRGQSVYYYKRACSFADYTIPTAASPTLSMYQFKLSDVPNYSELVSLYDQYQIAAVKMNFIPLINSVSANMAAGTGATGSFQNYMRSYSCLDYTNDAAAASIDAMREYQTYKWKPITRMHSRYMRVKPVTGDTAIYPGKSPWFDTSVATSQAYAGLLFAVDPVPTLPDGITLYRIELKYYLKFKTVH